MTPASLWDERGSLIRISLDKNSGENFTEPRQLSGTTYRARR